MIGSTNPHITSNLAHKKVESPSLTEQVTVAYNTSPYPCNVCKINLARWTPVADNAPNRAINATTSSLLSHPSNLNNLPLAGAKRSQVIGDDTLQDHLTTAAIIESVTPATTVTEEKPPTQEIITRQPHPTNPLRSLTIDLLGCYQAILNEKKDYTVKITNEKINFLSTGYKPLRKHNGRFQILGEGGYSVVLAATAKRPSAEPGLAVKEVAIKVNRASENLFKIAKEERNILKILGEHSVPFVTHLINDITFTNPNQLGLVFELFKGDLYQLLIQVRTKAKIRELVLPGQTVLLSLEGLRNAGIVHADLKPQNILLNDQDQAHIGDFGLAFMQESGPRNPLVQTIHYRSPEVHLRISDGKGKPAYTFAIDMFSLGAIMYECLTKSLLLPYTELQNQKHVHASEKNSTKFLYAMEQLFGPLPQSLIEKCNNRGDLFKTLPGSTGEKKYQLELPLNRSALGKTLQNEFAAIDKLPKWEALVTMQMNSIKQSTRNLSHLEAAPIIEKHRQFFDLITQMLKYEDRITPTEALNHSFFQS